MRDMTVVQATSAWPLRPAEQEALLKPATGRAVVAPVMAALVLLREWLRADPEPRKAEPEQPAGPLEPRALPESLLLPRTSRRTSPLLRALRRN